GLVEQPIGFRGEINLAVAALDPRELVERCVDRGGHGARIAARGANEIGGETLFVLDQDLQKMLRRDLLMGAALRQVLRGLDESFGALGVFLEIHDRPLSKRRGGSLLEATSPRLPKRYGGA